MLRAPIVAAYRLPSGPLTIISTQSRRKFADNLRPQPLHIANMSNRAAFVESAKGPIVVRDADIEQPGQGEVLIKVHACAIQPADAKVAKFAMIPIEYPGVLGSPVAGTVEAVGAGVSKVQVGQRVVCGTKVFVHKKPKYGGLQRYTLVDASEVLDIGDVSFTQAVTLGSYTPPGALFGESTLNLHYPSIPSTPLPASEQGKKVLIWGGSSAMGALSISYAKAAGYTVISTSSPHNFEILKKCGADHVFDHSADDTVDKIRDLFPIDYWHDTISLRPSLSTLFKIIAPNGKAEHPVKILTLLPLVMAGMKEDEVPEGVVIQMHRFSTHSPENAEWNKYFLAQGGFMEKGIKEGIIKGVPADVLGGLEKVEYGIHMLHKGVSGRKVVVEPWA